MKKIFAVLALAILLVPAMVLAQPPAGCTWDSDHALRYGWGQADGLPFNQPGPDYATIYAGQTLLYTLAPYNVNGSTYDPIHGETECYALDTLCFHAVSFQGWTLTFNPPAGEAFELDMGGYIWWQEISITAPCDVAIGDMDTIIAGSAYTNNAIVCAPECGDCADPNRRLSDGLTLYNADTLYLTVVVAPPALGILQDTLTLVERGQTQAYIPFSICNQDECAGVTTYNYNIVSMGHVGAAINMTGSVGAPGGECKDVYGIIDASGATACDYDTLTIVVWIGSTYDTCVQVIHVIEPQPVPLFTVPVITILVLALILAAAVFMRRRAVSRA